MRKAHDKTFRKHKCFMTFYLDSKTNFFFQNKQIVQGTKQNVDK